MSRGRWARASSPGIGVVGLLPVLESLFKRTTDITLLELTDYNHPLLRTHAARGAGHVPSLAGGRAALGKRGQRHRREPARRPRRARCSTTSARSTPTRSSSGRTQRDGVNRHSGNLARRNRRASSSQHVPDGVELAQQASSAERAVHRRHRSSTTAPRSSVISTSARVEAVARAASPRADAREEQGERRREKDKAQRIPPPRRFNLPPPFYLLPPRRSRPRAFRYDGPQAAEPSESAIISLADGVEATSRSLRQRGRGRACTRRSTGSSTTGSPTASSTTPRSRSSSSRASRIASTSRCSTCSTPAWRIPRPGRPRRPTTEARSQMRAECVADRRDSPFCWGRGALAASVAETRRGRRVPSRAQSFNAAAGSK